MPKVISPRELLGVECLFRPSLWENDRRSFKVGSTLEKLQYGNTLKVSISERQRRALLGSTSCWTPGTVCSNHYAIQPLDATPIELLNVGYVSKRVTAMC